MKVALIGATGNAGSRILAELRRREHTVRALVRHPERVQAQDGVTAYGVDANDVQDLAVALGGAEAVISSVKFKDTDTAGLIEAVRRACVPRYLVVGGSGSLEIAPGQLEVDRPDFPPQAHLNSLKGGEFLQQLRDSDLDWTYLSPSRSFFAGERTGSFRLGGDQMLFDSEGKSRISYEDYAVALVNELEQPRHSRTRFTVGY